MANGKDMPPGGDVGGDDLPFHRTDTGFGVRAADVRRGYTDPDIREPEAAELEHHKDRGRYPKRAFERLMSMDDFEEEARRNEQQGFLTRPRGEDR